MSKRTMVTAEQAAKDLEIAANAVLEAAVDVERDPRAPFHLKYLCDAVREWKAAGQSLHDAQVAQAKAS